METLMTEQRIEIDDAALIEAAQFLGTKTMADTVNAALREVMVRVRRAEALAELVSMAEAGEFDGPGDEEAPK